MKDIKTIGLDLAKNIFYIHGVDELGKTVLKRKLSRKQVLLFFSNLTPCLVGMEAGGGSHYWAREIARLGHETKIMAAQFVKPYIKSNKNDSNDVEAICEAVTRPNMRFVSVKSDRPACDFLLLLANATALFKDPTGRNPVLVPPDLAISS